MITRPEPNEHLPIVKKYIDSVPEGNIITILNDQFQKNQSLLNNLTEDIGNFRYASDKWSLKNVIGHIADVERLWSYMILRIARGDVGVLSGYDRDLFVANSFRDKLPLIMVLKDYEAVRKSTISLIETLPEKSISNIGEFNSHPFSVRACIYSIAGHETHHMNIIKSKYLNIG
ncbi:DinB family protein [Paenibacillus crassostreae]|uniref:Squalene--hopene cyclase n=1 Tax=Paenibacillus crassostreae TaxID=1763538 RepID=A0A167FCC3_9BACL|nr:DinB family protein [Paenibacillus crassostreae]AOZ90829.1 squalene--hopene cyclase [Paenibacillus crassostreae]OAB76406.1 squalene--hopene cyclase [Paenibacillus crassostreae]